MRNLYSLLLIISFLGGINRSCFAQTSDSTIISDSLVISDSIKVHSVRKATILSAVLPGAGQIYNHIAMPKGQKKAFWKVPLIYAGIGATTYLAIKNNSAQRDLKLEYQNRTLLGISNPEYDSYDNEGILTLYNQKLNRRDLFFMGLGLVYLIQVADAAVEAHFVSFDVSKDLTLNLRPKLIPFGNLATVGFGCTFNFR